MSAYRAVLNTEPVFKFIAGDRRHFLEFEVGSDDHEKKEET